ncbi:hypothetical protein FRB93_007979 [Tulasnella sp. JGI-2019a]|nr:hypothetical protein FRB93_007979 [Tulasnella sp. JGI-2019a]
MAEWIEDLGLSHTNPDSLLFWITEMALEVLELPDDNNKPSMEESLLLWTRQGSNPEDAILLNSGNKQA